jgi:hypothetical protein
MWTLSLLDSDAVLIFRSVRNKVIYPVQETANLLVSPVFAIVFFGGFTFVSRALLFFAPRIFSASPSRLCCFEFGREHSKFRHYCEPMPLLLESEKDTTQRRLVPRDGLEVNAIFLTSPEFRMTTADQKTAEHGR